MPYSGPTAAITSVLEKLGINPSERCGPGDQNPEYTACRSFELDAYLQLYLSTETTVDERAVLCCFLLEGLNELIQSEQPHVLEEQIIAAIMASEAQHAEELAYWTDTSDPDETNRWPLCRVLLRARASS